MPAASNPRDGSRVTHADFVSAHRHGTLQVVIDPKQAARFMSARLLLPFVMMPVLGAGIAIALVGQIWLGLALIAVGIIVPRLIKRSAPHFLLTQALGDEKVYRELVETGVMRIPS